MNVLSVELEQMQDAAEQACKLMKVLANPDRLMILCQLSRGEMRVGDIETLLGHRGRDEMIHRDDLALLKG